MSEYTLLSACRASSPRARISRLSTFMRISKTGAEMSASKVSRTLKRNITISMNNNVQKAETNTSKPC